MREDADAEFAMGSLLRFSFVAELSDDSTFRNLDIRPSEGHVVQRGTMNAIHHSCYPCISIRCGVDPVAAMHCGPRYSNIEVFGAFNSRLWS